MNPSEKDARKSKKASIHVSQRMLIGGFFFLPWLWLVNAMYFYRQLFAKGDKKIPQVQRNVRISFILGILFWIPLIVWYVYFAKNWRNWGTFGENLSFINVKGI
eukprot:TRINITY_DN6829_c0_g1_i1.p1 TRINITY_DN6829_c0_g1~~TRINITY_DN6829_c0_g1_i1.p1  ORF type:complete len:104 (-),score=20.77 TRINITY_DN6829_c0_g1_i1:125-436(-)